MGQTDVAALQSPTMSGKESLGSTDDTQRHAFHALSFILERLEWVWLKIWYIMQNLAILTRKSVWTALQELTSRSIEHMCILGPVYDDFVEV